MDAIEYRARCTASPCAKQRANHALHKRMDGWQRSNTGHARALQRPPARTEAAEVLDGGDVGAEEALHLGVHHFNGHLGLVWFEFGRSVGRVVKV